MKEMLSTWQWLAPEVIDHQNTDYDERADIYSFGTQIYIHVDIHNSTNMYILLIHVEICILLTCYTMSY